MPSGWTTPARPLDPARHPGREPLDMASPNQRICPFLRSIDDGDRLGIPFETPDPANRCAALSEPVPQSLRQQELVCLTSGHVNCPRYMRGAMTVDQAARPRPGGPDRDPGHRRVRPGADRCLPAVGRVRRRQRRAGPDRRRIGRSDRRGPGRGRDRRPDGDDRGRDAARHRDGRGDRQRPRRARPRPRARRPRRARPRAQPHAQSGTPPPRHRPPNPTAKPSSSRYALLKPCSGTPSCYVYVIRSGDNLYSIANYFGVPLKTVKAWNPWTADGLKAGRGLRIPPPTR